jgi:hypothetical protein
MAKVIETTLRKPCLVEHVVKHFGNYARFTEFDQMRTSDLRKVGGPPILRYLGSASKTYELAWKLAAEGIGSKVLRGGKMRSVAALFYEVGAALQFPDYFGENWAALEECLNDLSWLPAEGHVLLIVQPEAVLAAENNDSLDVLRRIFVRASDRWATPIATGERWDRPAIPFHVVLQIPADGGVLVSDRWGVGDGETLEDFDSPPTG